ncbi:hypothetical protein BDR26DRAFT_1012307 [Obelidium mucronatum]|nr:hypothetical protein BDR26DRAFT_1012307 [Obelidium mucronatum]
MQNGGGGHHAGALNPAAGFQAAGRNENRVLLVSSNENLSISNAGKLQYPAKTGVEYKVLGQKMGSVLEKGGVVPIPLGSLSDNVISRLFGVKDVPLSANDERSYQSTKDLDRVYTAPGMNVDHIIPLSISSQNNVAERIARIEETRPIKSRQAVKNLEALTLRQNQIRYKVADLQERLAQTPPNADKKRRSIERKIEHYKAQAALPSNRAKANFEQVNSYYNDLWDKAIAKGITPGNFLSDPSKPRELLERVYALEDAVNPPELRWNQDAENARYQELQQDSQWFRAEMIDHGIQDPGSMKVNGRRNSMQRKIRMNERMEAFVSVSQDVTTQAQNMKELLDFHMAELLDIENQQNQMFKALGEPYSTTAPLPATNNLDELVSRTERQKFTNDFHKGRLDRRLNSDLAALRQLEYEQEEKLAAAGVLIEPPIRDPPDLDSASQRFATIQLLKAKLANGNEQLAAISNAQNPAQQNPAIDATAVKEPINQTAPDVANDQEAAVPSATAAALATEDLTADPVAVVEEQDIEGQVLNTENDASVKEPVATEQGAGPSAIAAVLANEDLPEDSVAVVEQDVEEVAENQNTPDVTIEQLEEAVVPTVAAAVPDDLLEDEVTVEEQDIEVEAPVNDVEYAPAPAVPAVAAATAAVAQNQDTQLLRDLKEACAPLIQENLVSQAEVDAVSTVFEFTTCMVQIRYDRPDNAVADKLEAIGFDLEADSLEDYANDGHRDAVRNAISHAVNPRDIPFNELEEEVDIDEDQDLDGGVGHEDLGTNT